jgi:hypothetical protein
MANEDMAGDGDGGVRDHKISEPKVSKRHTLTMDIGEVRRKLPGFLS